MAIQFNNSLDKKTHFYLEIFVNCHARDESDEDNCKMMVMKDNYNKKISPFKFDYVNQMIQPVNVNVSFAVIDVLSTREVDLVYVLKFRFLMEYYDYRYISWFLF